jgi:hypothetical protein
LSTSRSQRGTRHDAVLGVGDDRKGAVKSNRLRLPAQCAAGSNQFPSAPISARMATRRLFTIPISHPKVEAAGQTSSSTVPSFCGTVGLLMWNSSGRSDSEESLILNSSIDPCWTTPPPAALDPDGISWPWATGRAL